MKPDPQALEDVPRTGKEYQRQKGPVPLTAIIIVLALAIAGAAYLWPLAVEQESPVATYHEGAVQGGD